MAMNDLPRQTLCKLIRQYGHELIDEPRRVRAMLRDLCPDSRREINVLGYAMDEQIPNSLLNASIALSPAILHATLSNRLCEQLALFEEAAQWAVQTWAFALNLDSTKERGAAISNARQEAPPRRPPNLLARIKKAHYLPTQPSKAALTAQKPAWAKLSGTFRLPSLKQSGMMQRLGRGRIYEVMLLHHQGGKEPTLLVIAGGGAALFDGSHQPLWEIDCPASCAALSHDKQLLALGCKSTIYLWNVQSGQFLPPLKEHTNWIKSIAFSPDGQFLASAGRDIKIWLWDVATGQALYYLSGHTKAINSLAFSPDGQMLVSASDDQTIRLWSLEEELHTLQGQSKEVNHVAFSPDGKSIVSASNDGTIRLWDVKQACQLHSFSLKKHLKSVRYVTFSPNGHLLASVDNATYQIELWDVANARHLRSLEGHSLLLESITFTPDSRRLISGSLDKSVRLWDISTGYELRKIEAHSNSVQSVAFSPDGRLLASLYHADQSIHLWDIRQERELPPLKGHRGFVRSIAFHPHQPRLASASSDETLRLWDIKRSIEVAHLNQTGQITQISFNPAGSTLAFINQETTLYLWHISSLSHLAANTVDSTPPTPKSDLKALKGHHKALTSLAFSPNGKLLASASRDGTICLWAVPSGREVSRLSPKHTSYAEQIAFSPDSRLLAAIESGTSMIRLWDLTTQEELSPLVGQTEQVTSIAFSPNRPLIASASVDGTIRLWHPHTARQEGRLEGHADYVTSVAFNPKDGTLASASRDGTIRLWQVG